MSLATESSAHAYGLSSIALISARNYSLRYGKLIMQKQNIFIHLALGLVVALLPFSAIAQTSSVSAGLIITDEQSRPASYIQSSHWLISNPRAPLRPINCECT